MKKSRASAPIYGILLMSVVFEYTKILNDPLWNSSIGNNGNIFSFRRIHINTGLDVKFSLMNLSFLNFSNSPSVKFPSEFIVSLVSFNFYFLPITNCLPKMCAGGQDNH